ncbi:30S ribosomal protein S4 [Mycoplasmopsis gallinacea]|uniref:Small ribosomal subunit protein uS4 n=1 Tax=Mycoplasmopsis gallinacea TaxID=29556 RepID=A0A449A2L1_9BACT|nr:30S ribosomal protein S4 [Mycoplasmopsis gallinacea]QIW62630.1 30S ribosomal protein S4 [Mycoplasmopsis gallinacea]VEU58467.1 30S ribosomal protein S4 [Mycoplasmopsis gallinacea]
MSRYTGPVFKKSRRLGFSILETGKEFAKGRKRTYAPGQHGNKRVKLSDYGLHLYEKQKVKHLYGVSEKQLVKTFQKAIKIKGVTGTNLLQLLEVRLDNLVYRAGFASTRRQARQLVNHGHFTLNGKKANIPSMVVSVNDVVELKEKSQKNQQILDSMEAKAASAWLTRKDFKVTLDRLPERNELHPEIKDALVVEFYSK